MYISYNETLAMEHSVASRRLIKSEWYQKLWGDRYSLLDDVDTKSVFANDKGGKRFITSIGSRVTGRGSNIIIYDDPNATNDAESEAILKTTNDFHDNTIRSRLNDKKTGAIVCIQQRVAENDLSGHLLDKYEGEYDLFMTPLEFEPERCVETSIGWKDPRTYAGEPLWPERFDDEFIAAEKRSPWVWAGQYQQRPYVKGGAIIDSDWWRLWDTGDRAKYPPFEYILASLDTAYGAKSDSDHSAMTIWGIFSEDLVEGYESRRFLDHEGRPVETDIGPKMRAPKVMLAYAFSENLQFHELIQKTVECCRRYKVDELIIEAKASGISVAQELKRLHGRERWMVRMVNPGNMDKVARLHSVVPIFTNGLVYAPNLAWAQMVINQVGQFPRGRYKDIVDTVSQALRHLRDLNMLEMREELEYDMEQSMCFGGRRDDRLYPV
jgi:predicted phage terminase large subunit-like protein